MKKNKLWYTPVLEIEPGSPILQADSLLWEEPTSNEGDPGSIPGLGRSPGGGHGNPLQYSCLENPHGQRSLMGYSPLGCQESDMIEWLSTTSTKKYLNKYLSWLKLHWVFVVVGGGYSHCGAFSPWTEEPGRSLELQSRTGLSTRLKQFNQFRKKSFKTWSS